MIPRALWIAEAGRAELREEALAPLEDGWCRVDAIYSAVSPGTERLVANGRVPEEIAEVMRCPYMDGSFAFPVKYGYSMVGRVSEGPEDVRGRLVHVLHPHQSRFDVRVGDVRFVPDGISPDRATLASNLETAVTALWDSRFRLRKVKTSPIRARGASPAAFTQATACPGRRLPLDSRQTAILPT